MRIAFDPCYRYELPPGHRFPMEKYELLPEQLLYEGTVTGDSFFRPRPLTRDEVLMTHTGEYIDKLFNLQLTASEVRKIGLPVTQKLVERGMVISGGTAACVDHAKKDGIALNIAGGTHHAHAGHGEGFCVFNDFAIAARLELLRQPDARILIVDLDVHQGNGTASIFSDEPAVFTFSMHGERNYPAIKAKSDLDIGLPDGTHDELYMKILSNVLPQLIDRVEPTLVFYLAGADILATDKLGKLAVSMAGCAQRDRYVMQLCKKHGIPVVVSMGGGYSSRLSAIIDAHTNTFRVAVEIFT